FLKVVVAVNGLMTISGSPHSTPIGAKLAVPAGSSVVRIDSMITAPIPRGAAGVARSPAPVWGAGGREGAEGAVRARRRRGQGASRCARSRRGGSGPAGGTRVR